jgi:basic membrane protein A and related proteins
MGDKGGSVNVKSKWRWLPAALIVLALAAIAAGCGGGGSSATTGGGGGASTGGKQFKIGLVSDTGGVDDKGFNQFTIAGLKRAETELGVTTRVYVSNSADDYLPNLQAAVQDGNDLVIAVGFLLGPSVVTAAKASPNTSFAAVDNFFGGDPCESTPSCETKSQPNVLGMIYPTEQAGYLAGIVAAMITKTKVVSTVGGKKIPPVDNWIAGYMQAVKDTDPSIKELNAYSDNFDDQAKCKEIALDQIANKSDVVFQVAGKCGLGALDAACEKNVNAIGVDADQSFAGPCVVTSALKPLESSVFALIKQFVDGQFKGGTNASFGIKDLPDAELLAPYTDAVPQAVQDAVEAAKQKIISGEITPPATIDAVK